MPLIDVHVDDTFDASHPQHSCRAVVRAPPQLTIARVISVHCVDALTGLAGAPKK